MPEPVSVSSQQRTPRPTGATGCARPAELTIEDRTGTLTASEFSWLNANLERALARIAKPGEVRVAILADDAMSAAHERFSGETGTTDVLTFDLASDTSAPLDCDLLICIDEARRQAQIRGHEPRRELLLYALHGVLHCLGEDDHDDAAFARMHAREDEILTAIGVGPTFKGGQP